MEKTVKENKNLFTFNGPYGWLIEEDGTVSKLEDNFKPDTFKKLLGCDSLDVISLESRNQKLIIPFEDVSEKELLSRKVNNLATLMYYEEYGHSGIIRGRAIICNKKLIK